jgi:ubiquinone/menaquinone biosynthesis C-methylase UbiE
MSHVQSWPLPRVPRVERFGRREVPVWYESSHAISRDFDVIAEKRRLLGIVPSPVPFYDWIMGFHERPSNRALLRGVDLDDARRAIEVGVGTGHLLSLLARRLPHIAAIVAADVSPAMLRASCERLERRGLLSHRIRFERCAATNLPFADGAFDLYASSYLFDLLGPSELTAALGEMERVLAPGGRALLVTMTTEVDGSSAAGDALRRCMNALYALGYERGRWNAVWRFLFAGYAPHCRPVALGSRLRGLGSLDVESTALSQVAGFPVRIYRLRKRHA